MGYRERLKSMQKESDRAAVWSTGFVWIGLWIYTDHIGWWNRDFGHFALGFFGSIVVSPLIAFGIVLPLLALVGSIRDGIIGGSRRATFRIVEFRGDGSRPPEYTAWLHVENRGWTEVGQGAWESRERAVGECQYLKRHAGRARLDVKPVDASAVGPRGITSRYAATMKNAPRNAS